jgi:hypothetical protein
LEALEERWTPAIKNWVGPGGVAVQDFNVGANWAPPGVPGAFDDAKIPAVVFNVEATSSVTVNSLDFPNELIVSGGTFKTINVFEQGFSSNQIGNLSVRNGAIFETDNATGDTTIRNGLTVEAGTTFETTSGLTMLDGALCYLSGKLMTDAGALTELRNGFWQLDSSTSLAGSGQYLMFGPVPSMYVNANVSVENFEMRSGELSGSHNLTITNTGKWFGGTMSGTGKTIIDSGADLELMTSEAEGVTLNRRTLINKGTINWFGDNDIHLLSHALIDNQSGAVFNTTGGGTQTMAGSTGTFRNAGVLYIGGSGTIGTLRIEGSFSQTLTGNLVVDINGTALGTDYSQLIVKGIARLNGTLTLNFGYCPLAGDTYTVLQTGGLHTQFATIDDSSLLTGWGFNLFATAYSPGNPGTLVLQGA